MVRLVSFAFVFFQLSLGVASRLKEAGNDFEDGVIHNYLRRANEPNCENAEDATSCAKIRNTCYWCQHAQQPDQYRCKFAADNAAWLSMSPAWKCSGATTTGTTSKMTESDNAGKGTGSNNEGSDSSKTGSGSESDNSGKGTGSNNEGSDSSKTGSGSGSDNSPKGTGSNKEGSASSKTGSGSETQGEESRSDPSPTIKKTRISPFNCGAQKNATACKVEYELCHWCYHKVTPHVWQCKYMQTPAIYLHQQQFWDCSGKAVPLVPSVPLVPVPDKPKYNCRAQRNEKTCVAHMDRCWWCRNKNKPKIFQCKFMQNGVVKKMSEEFWDCSNRPPKAPMPSKTTDKDDESTSRSEQGSKPTSATEGSDKSESDTKTTGNKSKNTGSSETSSTGAKSTEGGK